MREIFREVASIVIYNPILDKFLLQDRTSISKYGEEVTFFGGWLDEGEDPLQAAHRESSEELWIVFDSYQYLGKFVHDKEGKDFIRYLFFVITENEHFDDREWDGALRFSIQEAEKKIFTTSMIEEFIVIKKYIDEKQKR